MSNALKAAGDWIDARTGLVTWYFGGGRPTTVVPGGARWRYVCPAVLLFLFGIEVLTGVALWAAYSPSTRTAWESVFYIEDVLTAGSLVRGLHHYATHAMIVVAGLYLFQVVWERGYRAPREVQYWLGLAMLGVLVVFSQTGYLLPWDQRGYTATQVATEIAGSTPVVGDALLQVARGGPQFSHHTLTRFFALHAGVLPVAFVLLGFARWKLTHRLGYAVGDEQAGKPGERWWPGQAVRDFSASALALLATLLLAIYLTAPLGPPADASVPYAAARPEWWFLPVFRLLHIDGVGMFFGAQVVPMVALGLLAALPLLGGAKWVRTAGRVWIATLAVVLGAALAFCLYEDFAADTPHGRDFRASLARGEADAERARFLAASGVPVSGAADMLRRDPLAQGPRLFAQFCSTCHPYDGHDGTGAERVEVASAPDLGDFGTRAWQRGVLLEYADHFASLANAQGEWAEPAAELLDGDMAYWCEENREALLDDERGLAAVVEYVASQSGRDDLAPYDGELIELGRAAVAEGTLPGGGEIESCVGCHALVEADGTELLAEEDGYAPTLTGYGGTAWTRAMIARPHEHYGDVNAMPAFESQLSERQLDLLAKWLTGDYLQP